MIPNEEKRSGKSKGQEENTFGQWHNLAVKKVSTLSRKITSEKNYDFYCLNCLYSFTTEHKPEFHKKLWKNKDFCNIIMLSENTKILDFDQCQKSDKFLFIIFSDLECQIEKTENSSTAKESKHIASGTFRSTKNKHDVYKGNDCMKKCFECL